MPKLLFFSRVALLCNICFLFTFLIRYIPQIRNAWFVSTIVIIGLVMSIVINAIINVLYLMISVAGKPVSRFVPLWLVVINFLFFVFQAILLLK